VAESPIYQRDHAVGEKVLVEEFETVDLPFQEGVEA